MIISLGQNDLLMWDLIKKSRKKQLRKRKFKNLLGTSITTYLWLQSIKLIYDQQGFLRYLHMGDTQGHKLLMNFCCVCSRRAQFVYKASTCVARTQIKNHIAAWGKVSHGHNESLYIVYARNNFHKLLFYVNSGASESSSHEKGNYEISPVLKARVKKTIGDIIVAK